MRLRTVSFAAVILLGMVTPSASLPLLSTPDSSEMTFLAADPQAKLDFRQGAGFIGGWDCPPFLYGALLGGSAHTYYDTLRVSVNTHADGDLPPVGPFDDPTHCLGASSFPSKVGSTAGKLRLGHTYSMQSQACGTSGCSVDMGMDAVRWFAYVCEPDTVTFTPGDLGSSAVTGCTVRASYNLSSEVSTVSFEPDVSAYEDHVDRLVPQGSGSAYVVFCLFTDILDAPAGDRTTVSHDWFLALDLAEPGAWPGLLQAHFDGLQGIYDTSGDNGCPFSTTPVGAPLSHIRVSLF